MCDWTTWFHHITSSQHHITSHQNSWLFFGGYTSIISHYRIDVAYMMAILVSFAVSAVVLLRKIGAILSSEGSEGVVRQDSKYPCGM